MTLNKVNFKIKLICLHKIFRKVRLKRKNNQENKTKKKKKKTKKNTQSKQQTTSQKKLISERYFKCN